MKKNPYLYFFLSILLLYNHFSNAQTFESSNLPIVIINTEYAISDEPKRMGDMRIIDNGTGKRNYITDAPNGYKGKIGIELRGSTSQNFPKKPYGMELWDSTGASIAKKIFGFSEESDWILNASYNEKTFIRDPLAYWLARQQGRYASRTKYVELVLNGSYEGIYIFQEKIKRDKGRVDIDKLKTTDNAGDALTGGYILKIDKTTGTPARSWYSNYLSDNNSQAKTLFQIEYPKIADITDQQYTYIKNYVNGFESAIFSPDYKDTNTGYAKYIDVNSFIDYFLFTELTKNVDGYRLSTYFYKTRDSKGGKLFMGPAWDYNIAFGNGDYYDGWKPSGWAYQTGTIMPTTEGYRIPKWWGQLLSDFSFAEKCLKRWKELRKDAWSNTRINNVIDSTSTLLNESQTRNFQRWKILGQYVWPNYYVGKTYNDEVVWTKNWVSQRLNWLDSQLTAIGTLTATTPLTEKRRYLLVSPNPIQNQSVVRIEVPEAGKVLLEVKDLAGQIITTIHERYYAKGIIEIPWQIQHLPAGMYLINYTLDGQTVECQKIVVD
jgi:CotH kinase protein